VLLATAQVGTGKHRLIIAPEGNGRSRAHLIATEYDTRTPKHRVKTRHL